MRYVRTGSITGFLLTLTIAYFIRLWAIDHGHKLLGTLATIYMFILLLPLTIVLLLILFFILVVVFVKVFLGKKLQPFWQKNRNWTKGTDSF